MRLTFKLVDFKSGVVVHAYCSASRMVEAAGLLKTKNLSLTLPIQRDIISRGTNK